MKILYSAFDPVPWPKGSGTRIEATVTALVEAGAQVHLHTPAPPKSLAGFAECLEMPGLTHRPVQIEQENFLDRILDFRRSVQLLLEAERFEAAIFRSPWEGVPIVEGVARPIYEVHGFPSIELVSHYPALREQPHLLDQLIAEENYCLKHSRLFFTPSSTSRHFLMRRGVAPQKIQIIPNSVDLREIPDLSSSIENGQSSYRLGYMGTLAPWQGLGVLLEAVALLKRKVDCQIVIAGTRKGRWMRRIREMARHLRIHHQLEFHGPLPRPELFRVLSTCHLLMAPLPNDPRNGLQGCCPIKILEYMTCLRPIVSTAIQPVEEILSHNETALLVEPGSASALANGIFHLAENQAMGQEMAQRAFEVVRRDFPRHRFKQQISALWEEICSMKEIPPTGAPNELGGSNL